MTAIAGAPWHKESFDNFIREQLPALLAERLPLAGYEAVSSDKHICTVIVSVATENADLSVEFTDIPMPDKDGLFVISGKSYVVVPIATNEELDEAEILCVGEQLYRFVDKRLGKAPTGIKWDDHLVRSWLPLDKWITEFLFTGNVSEGISPAAQSLDETNWLSRYTHIRRILIQPPKRLLSPGHWGFVCPFESPEGPNLGRVHTVAVGAEIRDGRLQVLDENPGAGLGLSASMIPFIEHNSANRTLMGCNMMRQWQVPNEPEPAMVQTGNEPDTPYFWCGLNLLTAFIPWGVDTFDDGIVISESAAKRFKFDYPIEPGDKISNRHGSKGIISRILPDKEMPHLADGTAVELVYDFIGCHTRLNFGQVREALASRIAHAEGSPRLIPPFQAPDESDLIQRLSELGLPEQGMEILTLGRDAKELSRASMIGWVYWGRTVHDARGKLVATVSTSKGAPYSFGHPAGRQGQVQGLLEYCALRESGAFENIREIFNTRSVRREDAKTLADRVAAGTVEQAGPPAPGFEEVRERLCAAGIRVKFEEKKLTFQFVPPQGPTLKLAAPLPHPWLPDHELVEIGVFHELPAWQPLVRANDRAARMARSGAPESLRKQAFLRLGDSIRILFDQLLHRSHLLYFRQEIPGGPISRRNLFSGRGVIAPGIDLRIDQVGLPDEMAWVLFGPLVVREICSKDKALSKSDAAIEVEARTERATQLLDSIMARSWVIVNRAPTLWLTNQIAFRPVRQPGQAVRLHPMACPLMNADFDGDQVSVLLPITEAAQQEAGELLSMAGHLRRNPELIQLLVPSHASLWGLVSLSLTDRGMEEIIDLAGASVSAPEGYITRQSLTAAMQNVLKQYGVEPTLDRLQHLLWRGFQVAKESGASISPFFGANLEHPQEPESHDQDAWNLLSEDLGNRIASWSDFDDPTLGPQVLAVKSRSRGTVADLVSLVGSRGSLVDGSGVLVIMRHGFAQGLDSREMLAHVSGARELLADLEARYQTMMQAGPLSIGIEFEIGGFGDMQLRRWTKGFSVWSRAMQAQHPGLVFARAAATGEVDPLTDVDTRLFVGLPPL